MNLQLNPTPTNNNGKNLNMDWWISRKITVKLLFIVKPNHSLTNALFLLRQAQRNSYLVQNLPY